MNWTDRDIVFLKKHYPTKGTRYVAERLNISVHAVKSKATLLKIKRTNYNLGNDQTSFIRKHVNKMPYSEMAEILNIDIKKIKRYVWRYKLTDLHYENYTKEQTEYLIKNFRTKPYRLIAEKIGRSVDSIRDKLKRLNLKRTSEEILEINRKYASHTWFNGNPYNTLYNGAITIRKDSNGHRYKWIRIAKAKWEMLQVHNWEEKNGPIPKEKIIVAKDGNQMNCDPDNWMLVDRREHLERNSGRETLEDKFVARMIFPRDKALQQRVLKSPELIELKRNELKLKRELNGCNRQTKRNDTVRSEI
jgi:hypothetical protein